MYLCHVYAMSCSASMHPKMDAMNHWNYFSPVTISCCAKLASGVQNLFPCQTDKSLITSEIVTGRFLMIMVVSVGGVSGWSIWCLDYLVEDNLVMVKLIRLRGLKMIFKSWPSKIHHVTLESHRQFYKWNKFLLLYEKESHADRCNAL